GQPPSCASFRAPMAREISFPRTRHLALFGFGQQAEAKVGDNEAILVPIGVAADAAAGGPPAGVPLPPPAQPGAPGVPEKGALPAAARGEALAAGVHEPAPQAHVLPWVVVVDVAAPAGDVDRCRGLDGAPAPVRCASSLEGRQHAGDAAARAALLGEAVMLSGLERWYALGPAGAGYCRSCEMAFMEYLREGYGDHMQPFDGLDPLRNSALPVRERPFALQKQAHRLSEALAAGKRAVLRVRDEARRARSVEIAVLGRVGRLSGMALEICRHLDGLVFELSSLDPFAELLPLLAARAALGVRPVVAVLPKGATVAQVRQFAALATACDCDLMLGEDAPEEAQAALAGHRAFMALVRERYRPAAPLVDLELLFSPRCDHWSEGRHQRASAAALATLARGQWQPAVRLDLSGGTRSNLIVIAGGTALPVADAAGVRRHVDGGGDLLMIGRAAPVDEEGRVGEPLFAAVKSGLDRSGAGRVYVLEENAAEPLVIKALRELLGRGRPQVTLSGRGRILACAYLDPERKLDVHLVNLDLRESGFAPAQGVQVQIA